MRLSLTPDVPHANATVKGAHGIPLMFHVALGGDVRIAEMVIEAGGGEGLQGALHGAVMRNRVEMARWLLEHGASVDQKNFQGKTPLQVAEDDGFEEMAALLREHGT